MREEAGVDGGGGAAAEAGPIYGYKSDLEASEMVVKSKEGVAAAH